MGSVAGDQATVARYGLSWVALLGLGGWVVMHPTSACDPASTGPVVEGTDQLLRDVGPEVVRPALDRFEAALSELEVAVGAWASDGDEAKAGAQAAFATASTIWQELEVMQVGPAASTLTGADAGAADLRDEIYSWPTVNPCRVDQETVREAFRDEGYHEVNLVNAYGLDALEHLLWAGDANACPGQVDINSEGTWNALGPAGVAANRADFAVVLVDGLQSATGTLADAWAPDGGDFGSQLALAEGSPYVSEQEALNAVYDALFYLEASTKDRKLAEPLGLRDCTVDCAELVEGRASGLSTDWIAANLRGFRALFTGGSGHGFDDLLRDAGHGDVGDRVLEHVDGAIVVAEASSQPIDEYVVTNPRPAQDLHDAIALITDDLKGDLATILSLRLPLAAAGDND